MKPRDLMLRAVNLLGGPFGVSLGVVAPGNDYLGLGRMSLAAQAWPLGTWACRVVGRGLSWNWICKFPVLRQPPVFTRVSPQISEDLRGLLEQDVVKECNAQKLSLEHPRVSQHPETNFELRAMSGSLVVRIVICTKMYFFWYSPARSY